ncbi:hypothetical protein EV421DRAFT_1903980 [Armillaria borealis]|uniref:Uncharacterized protein n=1 Tax=Armillaria borealis TaxID=47425 RepID=A0AA39JJM3_9AGAR|nr:hypothetical protein EV421DRAFT_1903980 [Armillaria borealis]
MPAPATSSSKLHYRSSPANTKYVPVANPKSNQHKCCLPTSSNEETQPRHCQGPAAPASHSTHTAQQLTHSPPVACPKTPSLTSDHEIHDDSDIDDADCMDDADCIDHDEAALETINESGDSSHSADKNIEVGRKRKRSNRKARKLWKKKLTDYETNAEKKAYIKDICLLLGRYLPCTVDLWVDADDLIWAGMKQAERAEKMNKSVHNMPAKTCTEVSFAVLLKHMEHDVTFLDVFGVYKTKQTAVKAIIDSLHEGIKEGHATDTNKVWTHILTLMLKDPCNDTIAKPAPTSKSSYGFNHIDTGQLLCPQVHFEAFDEDLLLSLSDAMWTLKDEEIRLTRGYLLLRVFLHILCNNGNPTKQESKKQYNIAKINRMHQVTGCHIAYAACQTRYVLSSKTAWCEQDSAFNMNTFYIAIVDLFKQYPNDEWVTVMLGWWNEQVFGNAKGCMVTEVEKQEHAPESSVGKITAAHAAHAHAHAEALVAESSADDS